MLSPETSRPRVEQQLLALQEGVRGFEGALLRTDEDLRDVSSRAQRTVLNIMQELGSQSVGQNETLSRAVTAAHESVRGLERQIQSWVEESRERWRDTQSRASFQASNARQAAGALLNLVYS